jgi:ribosomal protein L34E
MSSRKIRVACVECKTHFYLSPPYKPDGNTCQDCYEKLSPSTAGECAWCERIISVGDRFRRTYGGTICAACNERMAWEPDYDVAGFHAKVLV